ncbi:MAG: hypothetical protein DDT38_00565 [Firmicutes bacterium]|nr:hypothetical protein [candidate division NPL-UPA2 bacterium]
MSKAQEQVTHSPQAEIYPPYLPGMLVLVLNIALMITAVILGVYGIIWLEAGVNTNLAIVFLVLGGFYLFIKGPIIFLGLKIVRPNEALVLTLFGVYHGTLKRAGFYFVNPFVSAVNPTAGVALTSGVVSGKLERQVVSPFQNKAISLKAVTLNNEKQKINDKLGNPIIIGIVVVWKVVNTAKAVFNVENYHEYLSIQCDSALRNIVRNYPYDLPNEESEMSLRGSSQEVAEKLRLELQEKVILAGLEVLEARITHLSYAPEIAAVMLQRQQASAIVDARQLIVQGAVDIVEMALAKLNENDVVKLDEERKAAMVSNLLVVLCGNRDVQPVVNSGTLY